MDKSFETLQQQIIRLKKQKPEHKELLSFYENILEAQSIIRPSIKVAPLSVNEDFMKIQIKEGFPLITKDEFVFDIASAVELFESLCKIGKNATVIMFDEIGKIEYAIGSGMIKLDTLLKNQFNNAYLDGIIKEFNLNKVILYFLVHMSIRPFLYAFAEQASHLVDQKTWLRGYCPICGSLPQISSIGGDGKRYYLCSLCGFEWHAERLKCPVCENMDQASLHFFSVEEQKALRIDICDKCKHYIKTIDTRHLEYETDLYLEDIITSHLDILATQKGYKRPVFSPWGQ
jgi:FdhE protein